MDFENVQEIDLAVIGGRAVDFTLVLGPRQTKLDVALVEKLFQHAATVQLVRLTSPGRNALDFTLSYYVGRAVAADPTGSFHVVSKDRGFDPLIEYLRSQHIRAMRHADFTTLVFSGSSKPQIPVPPAAPKPKPESKPKIQPPPNEDEQKRRVLEYLCKFPTKRPGTKDRLVSCVVTHLGQKITKADAWIIILALAQADHLVIDDKGKVTYHLEPR